MSILKLCLLYACLGGLILPLWAAQGQMTGESLILGEAIVGDLAGGESDLWTFELTRPTRLVLSAERFPPDPQSELDVRLEVRAPDGTTLAVDDNAGKGRDAYLVNILATQAGTYQALVSNLTTWAGGSYRLTVAESPFPPECQTPLGQMITGAMPSAVQGYPVLYRVYLPPCHELTNVRYPYVLLLHGSNSGDGLWDELGADEVIAREVAFGRLPRMALVLPFGGELANTNTFRAGASWEAVIVDELVPYISATYCLQTERAGRAIGGISRGGFWAFVVAFRHPALFSALGGHSPFFDLYHAPPTHNPLDLALAPAPRPPLRIWMDRGKNDYAQLNIDLQHERLTVNAIAHEFNLYAVGEHDNRYWSAHVDDYLAFYSREWALNEEGWPACR